MSWAQVSDELGKNPESADDSGRIRSQAQHPSTAGTAPAQITVDLNRAHSQILPAEKQILNYPRATVRPVVGTKTGEKLWVAKIWVAPGREALVNGRWVVKVSHSAPEVFWWAQRTAEHFRDIADFRETGELGRPHRRWAPQW